jgi:spore germination protein GerM
MNSMAHRGFTARLVFNQRNGLFVGQVLGLPATVHIRFQGGTVVELWRNCHRTFTTRLISTFRSTPPAAANPRNRSVAI